MNALPEIAVRRWRILASAMLSFFAVGMTFFAVPPLIGTLRASFALSNLEIGLLMGAIAVPAIVLSVPLGSALDRWPPRAAGLAGLGVMLVGAVAFAVAPGYGWLLAGRLAFGAGAPPIFLPDLSHGRQTMIYVTRLDHNTMVVNVLFRVRASSRMRRITAASFRWG